MSARPRLQSLPLAVWERDGLKAALLKAGLRADDVVRPDRLFWRFERDDDTPAGFGGLEMHGTDALSSRRRNCAAAAPSIFGPARPRNSSRISATGPAGARTCRPRSAPARSSPQTRTQPPSWSSGSDRGEFRAHGESGQPGDREIVSFEGPRVMVPRFVDPSSQPLWDRSLCALRAACVSGPRMRVVIWHNPKCATSRFW